MNKRTAQMIITFALLTICLLFIYDVPVRRVAARLSFLENNWTLVADDVIYEPVSAAGFVITNRISVQEGRVMQLRCTLPAQDFSQPCLLLKTRASDVTVMVDQETVFMHDHVSEGHHSRYIREVHFVDLPSSCAGKQLTLLLTPCADRSFGGMEAPVYGSYTDLVSYSTYLGLLPILMSLFLCMYGILFIMMSLVLSSQMPVLLSQVYAAILCLMIGIWMLGYHDLIPILMDDFLSRFLEYVMQFGCIPVFYFYMRSLQLPYFRKYDRVLEISLSILGFLIIALEWFFALPTSLLMGIYIPLAFIALWTVVRYFFHSLRVRQLEPSLVLQMFGLSILLICCLTHIVLYFACDFYGFTRGLFARNIMLIGVTMFQETQLINFFFFITRLVAEQMNHPDLEELAYRDYLTRLPNRADAEQVFVQMAQSQDDFCVVMLDLNGLKDVNDRYGHSEGDRFLSESAQAMRIAFGEGAYLSRVGGDEFVVVIEGETLSQVERRLESLEAILSHLGDATPDIERSIAYGYAFRHECAEISTDPAPETGADHGRRSFFSSGGHNSNERRKVSTERRRIVKLENEASSSSKYVSSTDVVFSVISLADRRMYERKRIMKSGRAG